MRLPVMQEAASMELLRKAVRRGGFVIFARTGGPRDDPPNLRVTF
jgi:hypothetical protein